MRNVQQPQHGQSGNQTSYSICQDPNPPVYSQESINTLLFMIQEEKLSGDLYQSFYEQTGITLFQRIATAEGRHLDALVVQATGAGVDVSSLIALPAGQYVNADLQDLYDQLIVTGSVSPEAALLVGQQVEMADIADLSNAMVSVVGTPLESVYSHLGVGSEHHLAAFNFWLGL